MKTSTTKNKTKTKMTKNISLAYDVPGIYKMLLTIPRYPHNIRTKKRIETNPPPIYENLDEKKNIVFFFGTKQNNLRLQVYAGRATLSINR